MLKLLRKMVKKGVKGGELNTHVISFPQWDAMMLVVL